MADIFAASEIVELGIQIEINGRDFYSTLVKRSKNKEAKDLFRYLADQEEKHIEVFQKILNLVKRYEPKEAYPLAYFSYMNSFASQYVFTKKLKGKEIAENVKDAREAADLGIAFEKDSIEFYEEMKKIVPEKDRSIVNRVIEEEKEHLSDLINIKEVLEF